MPVFIGALVASPTAVAADGTAIKAQENARAAAEIVLGPQLDSIDVTVTAGAGTIESEGGVVIVPEDPRDGLTFRTKAMGGLASIHLGFPRSAMTNNMIAVNGDAVYVDEAEGASYVVDPTPRGARIMVVIEASEDDVRRLHFDLDLPSGAVAVMRRDGGIDFIAESDGLAVEVGYIASPWAADATGAQVPTHFELTEGGFVQVVDLSGEVEFPVTVDPDVRLRWFGATIYFTKDETNRMLAGGSACLAILAVLGTAIPLGPVIVPATVVCGSVTAIAATAVALGKCVRYNLALGAWIGTCDDATSTVTVTKEFNADVPGSRTRSGDGYLFRANHQGDECVRYENTRGTLLGYVCPNRRNLPTNIHQRFRQGSTGSTTSGELRLRIYNGVNVSYGRVDADVICHRDRYERVINQELYSRFLPNTGGGDSAGSNRTFTVSDDRDVEMCNVIGLRFDVYFYGRSGTRYYFNNIVDYERYRD